ncbi:MAG: hypothetical protein U0529_06750 [Thermoanaerobaculia bacterium]
MRRPAAAAAAFVLALAACRSAAPPPLPADPPTTARAVSAVLAARDDAWRPRRFKALFRGEVSPKVGPVVRGYLALFWDGESLAWRASVPLAGAGRSGILRRSGGDAGELFPGRLDARDVLAALLGVPEEAPSGEGALVRDGRVELRLPSGEGRAVLVTGAGEVTGLVLPAGVRVEVSPGAGVPRRVEVHGPDGRALLTLESYGPWPEGEEAPGG